MLVAQHEAQHLELVLALGEVARELLEGAELHRHLRRRAHPRYPKVWPHGVPLGVCRLDLEGGARAHSQNSEFLYGGRVERKGEPQLNRLYSDAHGIARGVMSVLNDECQLPTALQPCTAVLICTAGVASVSYAFYLPGVSK